MVETGVIHGRFQVLHNDHLKYLLAGKSRCRHLVVGITNPDPVLTKLDPADPHRSAPEANPLTYFERYTLVRLALRDSGVREADFSVVPFPINFPEMYRYYVPLDGVFYLTVYDDWGRRKLEQFKSAGLRTEVLWTKPLEQKGLSSSDIRKRIALAEPWEHLVPVSVARCVKLWNLSERFRSLSIRP